MTVPVAPPSTGGAEDVGRRADGQDADRGVRPWVGLATVAVIAGIISVSIALFRGELADTVPVTVISSRAGLVMNPDAKVKLHGAQIGKVDSIEVRPGGQAALHLAMDPSQMHLLPANVLANIQSTTVFGAKFVDLKLPADPSPQRLRPGQTLNANQVTVEINTVFEQLVSVLDSIQPDQLNQTLGAIANAFNGRGERLGQAFGDADELLSTLNSSLPALDHDLDVLPEVANAYADAAPDLVRTAGNAARISRTIVDEQQNLDTLLVSVIGLADTGQDVVGTNAQALTDTLHVLVPTTELLNDYSPGLSCALGGILRQAKLPPSTVPGALTSPSFGLGIERYRYPKNLPKVAATGGPQCVNLPVPYGATAPFVVTDDGANPWQYGNQQLLLNAEGLKEALFGPLDGPPRNTAQIGQPG